MKLYRVLSYISISAMVVCGAHGSATELSRAAILGKWVAVDATGSVGSFTFHADGTAEIEKDGAQLSMSQPGGIEIYYTLDLTAKPALLEIRTVGTGGRTGTMRCIVELISNSRMKFRYAFGESAPQDFNGTPDDTIILQKEIDVKDDTKPGRDSGLAQPGL